MGDKKTEAGKVLESIYVDPLKSLCELKDRDRFVELASNELKGIRFLTPAYDCVAVAVMFQYLSAETVFVPTPTELRRLSSSTVEDLNNLDEEEVEKKEEEEEDELLRKIHDATRVMESALGLGQIYYASLLYEDFKRSSPNIFVAATQSRSVVEKYANDIKLSFVTVPCRILLMSDFSEECDDEVGFELLIRACTWCSSVVFERRYYSLKALLTCTLECYEILNSRFALEHRYETDSDTIHNRSLAS